jgi:hypothetical protein
MFTEVILLGGTAALAALGFRRMAASQHGEMTPARELIFKNLLTSVHDPKKLREMADTYQQQGLRHAAAMLRKKASNQELPADVKAARKEAFRKGMASTDVAGIEALAAAFEAEAAIASAEELRKRAQGLRDKAKIVVVESPEPEPAPVAVAASPAAAPAATKDETEVHGEHLNGVATGVAEFPQEDQNTEAS